MVRPATTTTSMCLVAQSEPRRPAGDLDCKVSSAAGKPSGFISFTDDGIPLGDATLTNGIATHHFCSRWRQPCTRSCLRRQYKL